MTAQMSLSVMDPIPWDTDSDLLDKPGTGHVRDRIMYVTVALLAAMKQSWGGVVTAVKTSTNVQTGDVLVCRADPRDPDAVPLRLIGTQNTAAFSFHRPLTKLNLKVPPTRQFVLTPQIHTVEGLGTLFVFPVAKRISVPRGRKGTNVPFTADPEEILNSAYDPLDQAAAASDPDLGAQ